MPVTPFATASWLPPDRPAICATPARRRLDEHDAETLLFEPEPSTATVHHHEVTRRQPLAVGRRRGPDRGRSPARWSFCASFSQSLSSRPAPPIKTRKSGTHPRSRAARTNQGVHSLSRHESRVGTDDELSSRRPATCAPRRARSASSGVNRHVSTPGGTWMTGGMYSAVLRRTWSRGTYPAQITTAAWRST